MTFTFTLGQSGGQIRGQGGRRRESWSLSSQGGGGVTGCRTYPENVEEETDVKR